MSKIAKRRTARSILLFSASLLLSLTGLSHSQPAGAQNSCSPGFERRTLEWSTDTNPDNGAVWSAGVNKFSMGDGLLATATLADAGAVDAPSTLTNSELLAQASPGSDGTLVWNLDTTNAENPPHSTLLFEFSQPVESFSVVVIDVDAKTSEDSSIGWHDQVTGFVEGEQTATSLLAADPSIVTVEGMTAWAADGQAKTPNESSAGNVTFSATGTIFTAGITYSDGPRSMASPERHAIGISSITVCAPGDGTETTAEAADTTGVETTGVETTEAETSVTTGPTTTSTEPSTSEGATAETLPTPTSPPPTTGDETTSTPDTPAEPSSTSASPEPASAAEQPPEALAVITTASKPVKADDDSYEYVYTITATNNDTKPIDSVQLFHNLEGSFTEASAWKVDNASATSGPCQTSSSYDGKGHDELLSSEAVLNPDQSCQIKVAVTVTPTEDGQRFSASATGSGSSDSSGAPESSKSSKSSKSSNQVSSDGTEAVVTTSDGTKELAYTGAEAEDFAAAGALLFILGAVMLGYDDRFVRSPNRVSEELAS